MILVPPNKSWRKKPEKINLIPSNLTTSYNKVKSIYFPSPVWALGAISSNSFRQLCPLPQIFPQYTCADRYSAEYPRGLYRSPSFFRCADLCFPGHPASFLVFLNSQLLSLQLKMCLAPYVTFSAPRAGISLRAECAWLVMDSTLISFLSWIILLCYLMFNRLKMIISVFISFSLVSDVRWITSPLFYLDWKWKLAVCFYFYFFYFASVFMFKNIILRQ